MDRKFSTFKADVEGKEVEFKVYVPTYKDHKEANKVRNDTFHDAIESNAPLQAELALKLESKQAWSKENQQKLEDLSEKLDDAERRLAEGGFNLDEAKKLALDMSGWRAQRRELYANLSILNNNTAEGQADNMAFNYLVSACLVYNKGDDEEVKYFDGLEDFLSRQSSVVAYMAASKLASLIHGIGDDVDKKLPENQFLLDFNFVNDDLKLINEDGHLVDVDGRLVNEDGRYIDKDGNLIDRSGRPVTDDGSFKVEFKGFVDKDGNTVMGKSREEKTVESTVEDSDVGESAQ